MTKEEWLPVAIAPDYEVSNLGRVRSRKADRPRLLKPGVNPLGYHNLALYNSGEPTFTTVHVLVMAAFVGSRPEGMDIRHLDGDPGNNHLDNLAYGSRSENCQDRRVHGTNVNLNKTECPSAHLYDSLNTYVDPEGNRHCRTCNAEATRRCRAKRRLGAAQERGVAA